MDAKSAIKQISNVWLKNAGYINYPEIILAKNEPAELVRFEEWSGKQTVSASTR